MMKMFCSLALVFSYIVVVAVAEIPDSTNIDVWDCLASPRQRWQMMKDKTVRLQANTSQCLDIELYGTSDGSNIWLSSCHTDDTLPAHQNQEWIFNSNKTITSTLSGKCLDVANSGKVSGTNVQLWTCTGSASQQWTFNATSGAIQNAMNGLCIDAGSTASCQMSPWSGYPYCDSKRSADDRAKDLISRLTLPEKVSLMENDNGGVPRLAVPPIAHTECTHGTLNSAGYETTLFPQAITVARSFDRDLLHMEARAIADEVRGKHNDGAKNGKTSYPFGLICWAPVVNLCRDPRWGRCQEGYGEDPYLQAELSAQYVDGLQNGPDKNHIEAVATCKHFDVHTGPENIPSSRFDFDSIVTYRDWVESFQPAFKGCGDAGALSYMCSYNSINGVPACANRELLTDLLRDRWNFTGFVVSDCGALGNVYSRHHFAGSEMEAAEFSLKAGCDWNCGGTFRQLQAAVEGGYVPEEYLDVALVRQARVWAMLGFFDDPSTVMYNNLTLSVVDEHKDLSLLGAMESIVLLENRNSLLPLDMSKYSKIALVGPCANDTTCPRGDYDPNPKYTVTPLQALSNHSTSSVKINFAPGCKDVNCADTSMFTDAINMGKASDLIIYVGGISKSIEGEGHDRSDIALPKNQEQLVQKLKGVGKPLVVVLMHGAPAISNVTFSSADALISTGYGGQEVGNALFNVLTGAHNPAGRLSVTWYTGNDQLPSMTDYNMTSTPGRTYRYLTTPPLYRFGYGLSYTQFSYANLTISPTTIKPCQSVTISVAVKNAGKMKGDEVVQVYLEYKNATVPVANIKLVGFDRLKGLSAGASQTANIQIAPTQMTVTESVEYSEIIEPGGYTLHVGGHQPSDDKAPGSVLTGMFTVEGNPTPLSSCK
ncbi:uncharacterized protein [Oscarella lobularis]|uniref:uncharacterized protein n=1 Tax=Oscarella lobularis TaxID=121494 RepID=UPI0033135C2E